MVFNRFPFTSSSSSSQSASVAALAAPKTSRLRRTLAKSPGVSPNDCRVIERCAHAFGQTYDAKYYKALAKHPAYFTSQFPGNRRGLTRVTAGSSDDQGRPTLIFVSAILSRQDWDAVLLGDIDVLASARGIWKWDESSAISAIEETLEGSPNIPAKIIGCALQVISQIERSIGSRRPVLTSELDVTFEVARAVEMLIPVPDRGKITTAFRVLSPQFPAVLVALASDAAGASNFQPKLTEALSPYAQRLRLSGIDNGAVPLACVQGGSSLGQKPAAEAKPTETTSYVKVVEPEYRTRLWPIILIAFFSIGIGSVLGFVFEVSRREGEVQKQNDLGKVYYNKEWMGVDEAYKSVNSRTLAANEQRARELQQNVEQGKAFYHGAWMSIEEAYRTKNDLVEYNGMWITSKQKEQLDRATITVRGRATSIVDALKAALASVNPAGTQPSGKSGGATQNRPEPPSQGGGK